jgi:rhodanese-related sulfurtransferase
MMTFTRFSQIHQALREQTEIALIDVREEDPFAQCHPLFAANLSLGRLEADAWTRIPRLDTPVVVMDNGEGLAPIAAQRLQALGYTQVSLLQGGLQGWIQDGGEVFKDVNVPSKSFGELVEHVRHTPSLSAPEVKALIDQKANMVVLDARRFDEYQTMSIPSGRSVPGAELVLRAAALAPDPSTHIVVNCAGRTRSIIGTQSLINAGLPNRITALRNGTIGWTLAGQKLAHGAQEKFKPVSETERQHAALRARAVADRAGVKRAHPEDLPRWATENRTTYCLDVRTPEEFIASHLAGFRSAPGGQLVQETDFSAPVRGARIVLFDDDGVRANMSASWLAQMNWDVHVLDGVDPQQLTESGPAPVRLPQAAAPQQFTSPQQLAQWLASPAGDTLVLDLGSSAAYVKGHVPGAAFVLRSQIAKDLPATLHKHPARLVLTCEQGLLSPYAAAEVAQIAKQPVWILQGGNAAWSHAGQALQAGETWLASPRIDRYRRPYEGTDAPRSAMQAYLDWEFGLVEQLGRDASHGFRVI